MTVTGRCACGACTVRAEGLSRELSACWCEPCRRWQGLVGMGLEVPQAGFSVAGPVRVWQSSAIGRRAFCGVCGSALGFWPLTGDGVVEPCPGLFGDAAGAVLHHENFVENRPATIRFNPEPRQLSAADYAARAPVVEGAPPPPPKDRMAGGCACGAVRFRLDSAGDTCGICHCDTCRRWTGGVCCYTATTRAGLRLEGSPDLLRWASSPGAERVSCATCGGKLWYEVVAGEGTGDIEVSLGVLDDMDGRPLRAEGFIDAKPHGYAFAGTHPRRTRAEVAG